MHVLNLFTQVEFIGEDGTDIGGLRREFFRPRELIAASVVQGGSALGQKPHVQVMDTCLIGGEDITSVSFILSR